jgi:hypothetical protein
LVPNCFVNNKTAPTWDDVAKGWYNGADKCIFAFYITAANTINPFHMQGDCVFHDSPYVSLAATDIDTVWTDVTINAPAIEDINALISVRMTTAVDNTGGYFTWRKNGGAGTGHLLLSGLSAAASYTRSVNSTRVGCDSTPKIELRNSVGDASSLTLETDAWFLPIGM